MEVEVASRVSLGMELRVEVGVENDCGDSGTNCSASSGRNSDGKGMKVGLRKGLRLE